MFHIPNESVGGRPWLIRNRQMGVKSGVPDLMLPIPASGYHGLFIEMKAEKGKISNQQERWLAALNAFGYHAVVCYGWEEAKDEILRYLGISHAGSMGDDENNMATKNLGGLEKDC